MLEELYQEVILDYSQSDKNRGDLVAVPGARHEIVHNPLCGDMIDLWLDARDGVVVDVRFCGSGCAISQASAALMAELVRGRRVADLPGMIDDFQKLLDGDDTADVRERLGELVALEGVRKFPVRRRCAALAFEALRRLVAEPANS